MTIPTIYTERLVLRPPCGSDWPNYYAFMSSSRAEYMDGPYNKTAAWGQFCHDVAQWRLMGHGALMIDKQTCGQCLGQVGINHGPLFPEHELGWLLYPDAEGHGYAYEAASALLDWATDTLKINSLVSYIDPGNTRSIALARRLGARLDKQAIAPASDDLVYRHF